MRLARTVLIDAPTDRVWALLDDERNIPQWMPHVVGTRFPDGKPAGDPVGARFIQTLQENGRTSEYIGEVTAYKPGHMLGLRLIPQAFVVDVCYYVTSDAERACTELVYTCETRANGWYGMVMLVLGRTMLANIADQQLARLKQVAEGGGSGHISRA